MIIESLQNQRVKRLVALQQKRRERNKQQLFVVEGEREVERALKCGFKLQELWVQDIDKVRDTVSANQVVQCTTAVFSKITYREQAAGMIAIFEMKATDFSSLKPENNPLYIVLENIEKPGNLGAILRTANGFGIDAAFVCDSSVDVYNPNVIRNSLGGFFDVPVVSCSSEAAIAHFKKGKIQIITSHLAAAKSFTEVNYNQPAVIVLGSEASGLSDLWVENTNANVIIPMQGVIDSLNISVAASILMAEAVRQRAGFI